MFVLIGMNECSWGGNYTATYFADWSCIAPCPLVFFPHFPLSLSIVFIVVMDWIDMYARCYVMYGLYAVYFFNFSIPSTIFFPVYQADT